MASDRKAGTVLLLEMGFSPDMAFFFFSVCTVGAVTVLIYLTDCVGSALC